MTLPPRPLSPRPRRRPSPLRRLSLHLSLSALAAALLGSTALAQTAPPPPDEGALGEILVTGSQATEKLPRIAVLPSLSPDYEDVIVRGVVRRDFELTGLYDVISDDKAPPGMYGFEDAVDIEAWRKLGPEAIVKVAARKAPSPDQIEVFGLAYLMSSGKKPVFEKKLTVKKTEARVTAHRITDALLGALTGRPGGFASELTFSGRWGKNRRIFRMDADGNGLLPFTDPKDTAIAPAFGPGNRIFYLVSHEYAPFSLASYFNQKNEVVGVPFKTSLYGVSLSRDGRMAQAVADNGKSAIFLGGADGSNMKAVSSTELATRPVFSPNGKLSWIGGEAKQGTQRVWLDGKAISPPGFTAGGQTFCDTEDGIRIVYSVAVGGGKQDLVMGDEKGRVIGRLTQGQGSNTYPACSPDGRLLAFFSTRGTAPGIYVMSLKSFRTQPISSQLGESLNWAALP